MENDHKKAISSIYSITELEPNIKKEEKINKTYLIESEESLKKSKLDSLNKSKEKSIRKFNIETEMLKNQNLLYEIHSINNSLDQNDINYNNNKISLEIQ